MRKRAWEIWCGKDRYFPVMLRTYYENSESEEGYMKFGEYAETSDLYSDVANCLALNDRELFGCGDN
jgi:hypothetical protein